MDDIYNTDNVNTPSNWKEDTSKIPVDKLREAQEGMKNSYGFVVPPAEITDFPVVESYDPPPPKKSNNLVIVIAICAVLIIAMIVGGVLAIVHFKSDDETTTATAATKVIHKPIDDARIYVDSPEEYQGHAYAIINYNDKNLSSYKECVKYCKSVGGHMAVIESQGENDFLFDFVRRTGNRTAYFGFSDRKAEGQWKWVNDKTINYTNWADGQPNNGAANGDGGPEDFAQFYDKDDSGKWNDVLWNNNTRSFICEWE